jgi:hypothetical protein
VLSRATLIIYRRWYVASQSHLQRPAYLPITNADKFPDPLIAFIAPATDKPPVKAEFRAVPFDIVAEHNPVIWTVTSDQERFEGRIRGHVVGIYFGVTLPAPKSSFNGGNITLPGFNEKLFRIKVNARDCGCGDPAAEKNQFFRNLLGNLCARPEGFPNSSVPIFVSSLLNTSCDASQFPVDMVACLEAALTRSSA